MIRLRTTAGTGLNLLLPLEQASSHELSWEERAAVYADQALDKAVAAQPPTDGEYERYHPQQTLRYEAALLNSLNTSGAAVADLTRIGVSSAELVASAPAVARSLWVLSYYADAQGTQLLSRNYLRLGAPEAKQAPASSSDHWGSVLQLAYRQPAFEHAVLYVPAGVDTCWLELRLVVARGGAQRVFTLDADAATRQLLALTLNPLTHRYVPSSGEQTVAFTELRAVTARNTLAPVLNQQLPALARYQTLAGGGYLPLTATSDFGATSPQ
jgi:hypothetical protein